MITVPGILRVRFFAAMILFVLVNVAVSAAYSARTLSLTKEGVLDSRYEARLQGPMSWWLARKWLLSDAAPDVVLFGSSQMGNTTFCAETRTCNGPVDVVEHRQVVTLEQDLKKHLGQDVTTMNCSVPGCMISDAYMISKALFRADRKPKVIVLGVGPRDFLDCNLSSVCYTESFIYFSPFVDLGRLADISFSNMFWRMDWFLTRTIPLKSAHIQIQSQLVALAQNLDKITFHALPAQAIIGTQTSRAILQTIFAVNGDIALGETKFGPESDTCAFRSNLAEYQKRYKNPKSKLYGIEKTYLEALLSFCDQNEIKVVVVGMPSMPENRALLPDWFWAQFRLDVVTACNKHGALFIDQWASEDYKKADYIDGVHFRSSGGLKLLQKIADDISASPTIAHALAGTSQDVAGKPAWH